MIRLSFCPICEPNKAVDYSWDAMNKLYQDEHVKINCSVCGSYEIGGTALADWFGEVGCQTTRGPQLARTEDGSPRYSLQD